MGTILGREPVAIAAVIAIVINLVITFGLKLSAEQVALINALAIGILNLVARQNVFSAATTQEIANNSTYEQPGTVIDIGDPPAGPGE